MARMTQILMRHPQTKQVARVSRRAFEGAHSRRGWEELDDAALAKLSKDELEDLARRFGVRVDSSDRKDEMAATIARAGTPPPPPEGSAGGT